MRLGCSGLVSSGPLVRRTTVVVRQYEVCYYVLMCVSALVLSGVLG